MPGVVVVPGLGAQLLKWRKAQRRSRIRWAISLRRHGSEIGPFKMRRMLAHAERTDEWRCDDAEGALGKFIRASEKALIRSHGHPGYAGDALCHVEARRLIYEALNDEIIYEPLSKNPTDKPVRDRLRRD